jgi:ankyrin repeat protein
MGAAQTVEAILARGFSPNRPLNFNRELVYPLRRSCARLHGRVIRILLEFGAHLNYLVARDSMMTVLNPGYRRGGEQIPAILEILSLLLENGATLDKNDIARILKSSEVDILDFLVHKCAESCHRILMPDSALEIILAREDLNDLALSTMTTILEYSHPSIGETGKSWHIVLSEALSKLVLHGRDEAAELLLAKGAHPNGDCLKSAVECGNLQILKRFLDMGARPDSRCFISAVRRKSPQVIELFLDLGLDPNTTTRSWDSLDNGPLKTATSECVNTRFREALQMFGQRGFLSKVGDRRDSYEATLTAACDVGDESLVDYLLSLPRCDWGNKLHTALTAAVRKRHEAVIRKLITANFIPSEETLLVAVRQRNGPLVESLMEIGYLLGDTGMDGILFEAVLWGNTDVIQRLLHAGALFDCWREISLPDYRDSAYTILLGKPRRVGVLYLPPPAWSGTPLSVAIMKGNLEAMELLLRSGASLNINGPRHWLSALAASVTTRDIALVQALLDRGADPFDNNALFIAAMHSERGILKALLQAFTQRYIRGAKRFGADALLWAIANDDEQMGELLAQSTDAHCRGDIVNNYYHESGLYVVLRSPLGAAIRRFCRSGGMSKVLRLLLQNGADPNCLLPGEGHARETALCLAIKYGSLEAVKLLRGFNANLALPAKWGITRTPLQSAIEAGNYEIVEYLLQQGVNPNEAPAVRNGATALQLAAIKGFIGLAITLLEKGAEVNAEPARFHGRTAFEGATEHGRIEMMILLVKNGADLLSNDRRQYRRAIQFAEENAQYPAIQTANELLEAVMSNSGTGKLGGAAFDMTRQGAFNGFGDFFSSKIRGSGPFVG